ncbi:ATP-grasp domain-containing protein [Kribbella soli]|uniref:ATP-grasp domain-containing protein n=1 Tax=Kribbella soli TaxID=1124743 RepID=A0A4R0HE53_9ACTN|nr:ATP-grasp domain-containing protein [Kribbella soli]TCC07874.1 ATP-grasp domain-containing protein [Kribbella soli]
MNDKTDGVVLQLGSGFQPYREYLIRGAAARSPLWLIDDEPATWQTPYIAGSSVVVPLEGAGLVLDHDGLLAAAEAVARTHGVRGVFTYDEPSVITTALVAERLGLPGLTARGAQGCRDKVRTREALTAAGLPQPRFAVAATAAEAATAAADIGYPVVVKPRGMAASIGVAVVSDSAGITDAFERADSSSRNGPAEYHGGALIEELVDGPEISVDGAVVAGEYLPFCVAHKQLGEPPYFEEVGHLVDGADPLLDDPELRELLRAAHEAIGAPYGITHTEIRFSSRGPVVIEINGRLGGDLIPYLGKLATGIDPGAVLVDVARGTRPRLDPDHRTCVGIRFCYPPEDCRVVEITVPEPGSAPGLVEAHPMVGSGVTVRLPPRAHIGRHAYVVCSADDLATLADRLTAAADLVHLKYDALNEPEYSGRPW